MSRAASITITVNRLRLVIRWNSISIKAVSSFHDQLTDYTDIMHFSHYEAASTPFRVLFFGVKLAELARGLFPYKFVPLFFPYKALFFHTCIQF